MREPEYKRAFTGSAYTTAANHQVCTSAQSPSGYENVLWADNTSHQVTVKPFSRGTLFWSMSDGLITAVHCSQVCDGIEGKTPHCT